MSKQRQWIWFRDGKPFRTTGDLTEWSGSTFSEGDVVEEVYTAAYVTELEMERDTLKAECDEHVKMFHSTCADLIAVTQERDDLKAKIAASPSV